FTLSGPGSGSVVNGILFGTTGGANFGAFALIDKFFITAFQYGITWGSQSWLQSIGDGFIQNCLYGIRYPSGLSTSGENIQLGNITLSSNTNGVYCAGGFL